MALGKIRIVVVQVYFCYTKSIHLNLLNWQFNQSIWSWKEDYMISMNISVLIQTLTAKVLTGEFSLWVQEVSNFINTITVSHSQKLSLRDEIFQLFNWFQLFSPLNFPYYSCLITFQCFSSISDFFRTANLMPALCTVWPGAFVSLISI